jgi:hypothetical protein
VVAALRALKVPDQLAQRACRLKAKLSVKECSVACELAHRLRLVALGQMHLDESGTAAFSERVRSHGRAGSASGFTPAANRCEAAGKRFQGMESKLPPVFTLDRAIVKNCGLTPRPEDATSFLIGHLLGAWSSCLRWLRITSLSWS